MDDLKHNFIFYMVILLNYYALPLLIQDTSSGMIILLIVIPFINFITSILYGIKNGFHLWYALMVALMFIPSIFIFYNASAWIYTFLYWGLALLGNMIALIIKKKF